MTKLLAVPTVDSIVRADTDPTSASSLDFTVTFCKSVSGVDETDFVVDQSGVSGAAVTGATGSGTTWTVTVSTGTGDGTLSIDLSDNDTIVDGNSVPLGGTGASNGDYTAGEAYTIDKTAPGVSIGSPSATDTAGGPVTYTVTYTDADTVNLTTDDITLNASGASATVGVTNGTTSTPTVTLSSITGDGTLGISVDAATSSDDAGNTDLGAGPSGTFNVDNTGPGVSIGAPSASETAGGPVSFLVTYSGASSVSLTMGDITLNASGASATVGVTDGTTSTPTVTLSSITGDGTLGISVGAANSADALGNTDLGAGPSSTFTVDNTGPEVSISAPSATDTNSGPVAFDITYTGASSVNLTMGDITLNASGASATVGVTDGTTDTPTVTLSGITGDGTLGISIDAATSSDALNNDDLGAGPSGTFNVDNTTPVVSVDSLTTIDDTPQLTGVVDDASASISVTVSGQANGATNNGATWTLSDGTLSALLPGIYDILVTATDAAGNVGSDATSDELTIQFSNQIIFVDFVSGSPSGTGEESDPVDTISAALALVQVGGIIRIDSGSTTDAPTINQEVTLERNGVSGTVTIGPPPARSESRSGFVSRPRTRTQQE